MALSSLSHEAHPQVRGSDVWSSLGGLVTWTTRAVRAYRERRALAALSDSLLKDLGLTRGDIDRVTGGPLLGAIDYRELERVRGLNRRRPSN